MPFLNGTHAAEEANFVPNPGEDGVTPGSLARLNIDMVRVFLKRGALKRFKPRFRSFVSMHVVAPKPLRTFGRHA
ncbi:MAG: hypothetical protein E5V86_08820 [Mesorhizobium sp.]|nr:MAG: hypothetical protein E5V86_08820 [Mesorhizobium sp.]